MLEERADPRVKLAAAVRSMDVEAWQAAELHLLQAGLRERLDALGIAVTPDLAVALMATSTFLANHSPEWGGDARDCLAEIALLGLTFLEDDSAVGNGATA